MNTNKFYQLNPDEVMNAVESLGLQPTGQFFQLNSYENRVFEIFLEDQKKLIFKFYRPERWSKEAILDEHRFLKELQMEGIPVVPPVEFGQNKTLFNHEGIFFTAFAKARGRMPSEFSSADLKSVGRLLAQIHNIGQRKPSEHRPHFTVQEMGWSSLDRLKTYIAPEVSARYQKAAEHILYYLEDELNPEEHIRIHGDCHRGNLLTTDTATAETPFIIVDFDDHCMGPEIQDFWMLLSGDPELKDQEMEMLISGYDEFRAFPDHQEHMIPALRGLRIIHYAGWVAKRWSDPSFPKLFPNFLNYSYWAEETEALEKIAWSL